MNVPLLPVLLASLFVLGVVAWPLTVQQRPQFLAPSDRIVSSTSGADLACRVSYDGFVWYRVGPGRFPPIAALHEDCPSGVRLVGERFPEIPRWAKPDGPTHALFTVVSLYELVSPDGMDRLASIAHQYRIPVTWMTGQPLTFDTAAGLYERFHRDFGDDLQTRPTNHNPYTPDTPTRTEFAPLAHSKFNWFVPSVAIEGSGYARDIHTDMAEGYRAFWGIAWNSHGLDSDYDEGTPWGAYCADAASFKRPSPTGECTLVGLEWTARDLTRAAISDHEEFYSTDPDDLQVAGFGASDGAAYVRALVDAYAAAGQITPLVMVVQQEADQMQHPPPGSTLGTSAAILNALYNQARIDGMRSVTLAAAARDAARFPRSPRAIAFPYIASIAMPEAWAPWSPRGPLPATIDYHDASAGMSFIAGRTTPVRVFLYARARTSATRLTLPRLQISEMPQLVFANFHGGALTLRFDSPVATRFGVALWSDPAFVRWTAQHADVTYAGRAAAVAAFDLRRGVNEIVLRCTGCDSATFPVAP